MGDNSPKNQNKLGAQKQKEHVQQDHKKLENAAHQHHPDRALTAEEKLALEKDEAASDAAAS